MDKQESAWLKDAEVYAKSKGVLYLDFDDTKFWLDYRNHYGLTPEEAVDDYLMEE